MENRQADVRRKIANPELIARLRSKALTGLVVLIAGSLILFWRTVATFTSEELRAQSSHRTLCDGFAARIEEAIR
ncbi:hypothetical protein E2C06_18225 [Dankookia rubra]|uniref:Uncharacterized protein n=1 Tax=Dankookia rubra TaxID=1442381 RepID=A0A4R5QDY2_9PROT|nr:hypothetical protein [Dankookia rubra]TDH61176.1 hypothetical protein E2C06_18225 [Dankookia rubra]